jgi:hypothetical protein
VIRTITIPSSKANKPISYNLRHFIIKQYIYRLITIRLYETGTFTCYTIDNSKKQHVFYFITGDLLRQISCIYLAHKRKKYEKNIKNDIFVKKCVFSTFYDPRLYPRPYSRHTTFNPRHTTYRDTPYSQGQNENINKTYIWLYSNHMALNYT